jgi:DNA polymerase-3 subunit epsilon
MPGAEVNSDPVVEREIRELIVNALADPDRVPLVADVLAAHPDYRVLRRFRPREYYECANPTAIKVGLYVDVETTGLDPETDEIIQLSIVPFRFDNEPTGAERILQVLKGDVWLEQPSTPIPLEVERLTGITNDMVRGCRIDDAAVRAIVDDPSVALVVAHFAEFDRRRIERRFPDSAFVKLPWACSSREVEWVRRYGAIAAKLGAALAAFGEFTDDAHDALEDCLVGIHVLASSKPCETCGGYGFLPPGDGTPDEMRRAESESPCPDCVRGERRPFVDLLQSARRLDYRLQVNPPKGSNDRLKARRYKARYDNAGKFQFWYLDVKASDVPSERAWLVEAFGADVDIRFTKIGARDRYSIRAA